MDTLHTQTGYRATPITNNARAKLNWLFFPGGPGLGSQSLGDLGAQLDLPGNTWYIDYPNDGDNQISDESNFDQWPTGLIKLITSFENVIVVAHSFGGMFILSNTEIEKHIKGLVLMDTAPDKKWLERLANDEDDFASSGMQEASEAFLKYPSDDTFKNYTFTRAHYFFLDSSLEKGKALLNTLPFCYKAYHWVLSSFHPYYHRAFIPEKIPTLIFAGDKDHLTPISLFSEKQEWQRDNIKIATIDNAGHFPWLDNLAEVKELFEAYHKNKSFLLL